MITVRNLLLSGQSTPDDSIPTPAQILFPEIRARWADETVYRIVVQSISGSPTAASVTARFQAAQTTTGGLTGVAHTNTMDYAAVWADVTASTNPGLFPDGDWPSPLATQTLATPTLIMRRIGGGFSHRLVLDMSYTGGTSPRFFFSVECEQRGS